VPFRGHLGARQASDNPKHNRTVANVSYQAAQLTRRGALKSLASLP